MKAYPAIDVSTDAPDLLLALVDDYGPTAVDEERAGSVRVFFASSDARDAALRALAPRFDATAIEVADDDWARRSQENLAPVAVGRVTVHPGVDSRASDTDTISLVVVPSMGFGTGHHATTRLCLAALQSVPLANKTVLDVGTGSGVLAIAARRLGAARSLGIDNDPDAIESARDNLRLNPEATDVAFELRDVSGSPLPPADIVTANLTGALLIRSAAALLAAVPPGGVLILSGILDHERDAVVDAFGPATVVWERREDEWAAVVIAPRAGG